MYSTAHYLLSLALVLTNCIHPTNWKHCLAIHQWLPPYISDYTVYYDKYEKYSFDYVQ